MDRFRFGISLVDGKSLIQCQTMLIDSFDTKQFIQWIQCYVRQLSKIQNNLHSVSTSLGNRSIAPPCSMQIGCCNYHYYLHFDRTGLSMNIVKRQGNLAASAVKII